MPGSARGSEIELAVLGAADERVPLGRGEDQRWAVRILRVTDRDRVIHERHFHAIVTGRTAPTALQPPRTAQINTQPFGLDLHNGSFVSTAPGSILIHSITNGRPGAS